MHALAMAASAYRLANWQQLGLVMGGAVCSGAVQKFTFHFSLAWTFHIGTPQDAMATTEQSHTDGPASNAAYPAESFNGL